MSLARVERWEEEVVLVQEEMRRTLAFLAAKRTQWTVRTTVQSDGADNEAIVSSGLTAYANRQADLCHALANNFAQIWLELYKDAQLSLPTSWPNEYLSPTVDPKKIKRRRERVGNRKKLVALLSGTESGDHDVH